MVERIAFAVSLPKPALRAPPAASKAGPSGFGGPPRRGAVDLRGDLHAVGRLGGELLHDEAAGLARFHAGDGAEREPRAGRLDDLVGRAEEWARLQRNHGERRPRPDADEFVLLVVKERLIGHRFQNPCDGMRNARLKREDAFSHAMIIVSSAMVSS
jgi:hypothetical protein